MIKVQNVYDAALALMDECEGGSITPEPGFSLRAVSLINMLRCEMLSLLGDKSAYAPVESMESEIEGLSPDFAMSVLPYGIAAHLLIDEQSAMAAFYHERYTELMRGLAKREKAQSEDIKNLYMRAEECL